MLQSKYFFLLFGLLNFYGNRQKNVLSYYSIHIMYIGFKLWNKLHSAFEIEGIIIHTSQSSYVAISDVKYSLFEQPISWCVSSQLSLSAQLWQLTLSSLQASDVTRYARARMSVVARLPPLVLVSLISQFRRWRLTNTFWRLLTRK